MEYYDVLCCDKVTVTHATGCATLLGGTFHEKSQEVRLPRAMTYREVTGTLGLLWGGVYLRKSRRAS